MTKNTLDCCAPRPATGAANGASTPATTRRPTVVPRADIWETDCAAQLAIELPGVTQDDVQVRIENDHLIVEATPKIDEPEGQVRRLEWRATAFRRSFALTDDADRDAIEADLKNGLLTVLIPRRAEKRPRTIEVRVDT